MRALKFLALLVACLALPASAQTLFLELDPSRVTEQEPAPELRPCDILHELYPVYCRYWHVVEVIEVAAPLERGQQFRAESAKGTGTFQVQWAGPNFLLENGAMVAPVGGLRSEEVIGARWIETYPAQGRSRVVIGWSDLDKDGKVGALDTVVLDHDGETRITGQRFGLFVRPTESR